LSCSLLFIVVKKNAFEPKDLNCIMLFTDSQNALAYKHYIVSDMNQLEF